MSPAFLSPILYYGIDGYSWIHDKFFTSLFGDNNKEKNSLRPPLLVSFSEKVHFLGPKKCASVANFAKFFFFFLHELKEINYFF